MPVLRFYLLRYHFLRSLCLPPVTDSHRLLPLYSIYHHFTVTVVSATRFLHFSPFYRLPAATLSAVIPALPHGFLPVIPGALPTA